MSSEKGWWGFGSILMLSASPLSDSLRNGAYNSESSFTVILDSHG